MTGPSAATTLRTEPPRRAARWIMPADGDAAVPSLAAALGIQLPAARVLYQRGHQTAESASAFLEPSLDHLHDPLLLKDMDRAVERLHLALQTKEKILLYGDYDVDGTTSIVILKKVLDLAGGNVEFHVPHRLKEGYGMRPEVIDRACADGVTLVVSVDTGIRANAVVEHARTLGIDVIVTDHHLPEAELPLAVAVINPNRPDCTYPEKDLCGAGVTFKLVQALLRRLEWPADRIRRMTESLMKIVAVATIADVVPLRGENRVIVKRGLAGFNTVRNPGLRALMRVAGFTDGECPSSGQIAFRIAPRINAAGRMANAEDVINLFLTGDDNRARELAAQLHDLNQERRDTEADIVKTILEECARVPVTDEDFALVFSGRDWHRGVVGIVASRLVERFHRPAFVISEDSESGQASGSGRSVRAFHLLEAMETMPELFLKFGGHRQAAGLTLLNSDVESFRQRLNKHASGKLVAEDFCRTFEIDAALNWTELNEVSVAQIHALAPFGLGNPDPYFVVFNAEVASAPVILKEKHLRVPIRQNGRIVVLKAWNFAERIEELRPGQKLDLVVCVEEDAYSASRGYPNWCVVLKDVRPASGTV